jgi:hypothetical protein
LTGRRRLCSKASAKNIVTGTSSWKADPTAGNGLSCVTSQGKQRVETALLVCGCQNGEQQYETSSMQRGGDGPRPQRHNRQQFVVRLRSPKLYLGPKAKLGSKHSDAEKCAPPPTLRTQPRVPQFPQFASLNRINKLSCPAIEARQPGFSRILAICVLKGNSVPLEKRQQRSTSSIWNAYRNHH